MLHINSKTKSLILNLSNMKINYLKLGIMALMFMAGTAIQAQTTSGDLTKQTDAVPGTTTTGGAIKVIDNKGTIKYLQAENGITMLSNTTNDVTTTTWQLGGTFTSDTTLDFNGNTFSFDNVLESTVTTQATSSTIGTSGFTVLVRDEATGNVLKMLASGLIQGGHTTNTLSADSAADFTITATGTLAADYDKVWVYRNGAKLIANTDYTLTNDTVTIVVAGLPGAKAFSGDVFEVQWIL